MPVLPWAFRYRRAAIAGLALLGLAASSPLALAVEALIRARIDPRRFDGPTRFYAAPLVITPDQRVSRNLVQGTLDRLGYRRVRGNRVRPGEYALGSRTWVIGRRLFRLGATLDSGGVAVVQVAYDGWVWSVRDAGGEWLPSIALEPEPLAAPSGSTADRIAVPLADVPAHLVDAVLAIEDQRFFDHGGLDVTRIAGAALANARAGRVVQGGSTLTQQLAKNLFLSPARTPIRKLREMAMAVVLEWRYDKEEILEAYLNEIYLGQDGGRAVHGVGRAAQLYFGKDVSRLDVPEAALLAGMIRGPNLYHPGRHPDVARDRRDVVLGRMHELDILSDDGLEHAQEAPLGVRQEAPRPQRAGYFVDYVTAQLTTALGGAAVRRGLTVITTVDAGLQELAERAVADGLARLEAWYPRVARGDEPLQAALVAIDPQTGEILAMVGGRDYGASQFNRAVHARRQPGSAFKPIVAMAALSAAGGHTLATRLNDAPLSLDTPQGVWRPVNYDGRFRGSVTLRDALERSLNVPFARIGLAVGPERIVDAARRLGIEGPLPAVPSLALGSSEVTPLELTRAFGVIAAGGVRARTITTLLVTDRGGEAVVRADAGHERVYDAAEAYLVTSALRGAVEHGTGRALRDMGYRGPVAAKSGTTNGFRDAWFVGYTPSLAVGVWVGFDDGRSIDLPGSRAALPVFARFLAAASSFREYQDAFVMPPGVEIVEVDPETGLRAGPGCRGEPEVFLWGTAPEERCGFNRWRQYSREIERLPRHLRDMVEDLLRRRGQ
jgi:penicillin-binding protein 1B